MCGIVGYIGSRDASEVLLDGLKRLEYRGYDSAGVAVLHDSDGQDQPTFTIHRTEGKLVNLIERVAKSPTQGSLGLGHTRWATHGSPSEMNAHPHWSDRVVVVHNGIIENYRELRNWLSEQGYNFTSDTDTEVIPHMIEHYWQESGSLEEAFHSCIQKLTGSYAVGMFAKNKPRQIYAAKSKSPLILGLGDGENFLASDIPALLSYTRNIVVLEDGDVACMNESGVQVRKLGGDAVERKPKRVTWTAAMAEKGGYRHFMLKEIHEQPAAVIQTIQGRINQSEGKLTLDEVELTPEIVQGIRKICIVACGTSWHAGLVGKYTIESLARVPVEVDLASEFRYRNPVVDDSTLVITISQSGETTDTLCALEEAKSKKAQVLSICNVLDASIPRAADFNFYTHAGPEIGVASTKAFTTQLVTLYMLALHIACIRKEIDEKKLKQYLDDLIALPGLIETALQCEETIVGIARRFFQYSDFLYLGRGLSYPIALEGALKLKEISYIHAEGYPAGEIKHGPIALVDDKMPVLVIAPKDVTYDKTLANISEVKARGGITILCLTEKQKKESLSLSDIDEIITTPDSNPFLLPVIQTVPLQLLSYHIAVLRGTDVDQPRNLAKSVTVE